MSVIIATTLLILLSVAAISTIAMYIIPWAKKTLYSSGGCLPYRDYFIFEDESKYNCHTGNLYGFTVKAKTGVSEELSKEIVGFKVEFSEENRYDVFNVERGADSDPNGIRMLDNGAISIPNPGETATYVLNSVNNYRKIKIYPVYLDINNNYAVCEASDSMEFGNCEEGVVL